MRGANDAWSPEDVETLKRLWLDGLSAGQIARIIKGKSRNAVLGKIHRLPDMPARTGNSGARIIRGAKLRSEKRARRVTLTLKQKVQALRKQPEPEPLRLENGQLVGVEEVNDRMCRWPHGDPQMPSFHFCGCSPKPGSPYCEVHAARAIELPQRNRQPSKDTQELRQKAERLMARMWG